MAKCVICNKTMGLFQKYNQLENINGIPGTSIVCGVCTHELNIKKQLCFNIKKFSKELKEIYSEIEKLFETPIEKEYAKTILKQYIESGDEYPIIHLFEDLVGYKSKVLKKLRELDILTKEDKVTYRFLLIESKDLSLVKEPKRFLEEILKILKSKIVLTSNLNKSSENRYVCSECEYKWESKKSFGVPGKCPRCNSKKIVHFKKLQELLT